jgi:hypothetical protein
LITSTDSIDAPCVPVTASVDALLTPEIHKPARYLGNERGAVHKPWEQAAVRWVLTYPEVYEVGASNLGHIILYGILNAQPRQLCDRAYLPAADLAQKLQDTQTPLFAVESRRSLVDFDILGFSLSYELGATNILVMLDLAGIPLTWRERSETRQPNGEPWPLIFAGGKPPPPTPSPTPTSSISSPWGMGKSCCRKLAWWWKRAKAPDWSEKPCCWI